MPRKRISRRSRKKGSGIRRRSRRLSRRRGSGMRRSRRRYSRKRGGSFLTAGMDRNGISNLRKMFGGRLPFFVPF